MKNILINKRALLFAMFYILLIFLLNIYTLLNGIYDSANIYATISMLICAYPLIRFLQRGDERVPFFSIISLLYALYYCVFIFTPFDPSKNFFGTGRDAIKVSCQLSLLGITALLLGYYVRVPLIIRIKELSFFSTKWEEARARKLAILFGAFSLFIQILTKVYIVSGPIVSMVNFIYQLSFLSICILYLFKLKNKLTKGYQIFLFWILIPVNVLISLSSGIVFIPIRIVFCLLLIHIAVKRSFPWRMFSIGVFGSIVALGFKGEYRQQVGYDTQVDYNSLFDVVNKGIDFIEILFSSIVNLGANNITEPIEKVFQRLDLIYLFAYVIERTPSSIPYYGGMTYSDILWKFVPRFIYPDKPNYQWGNIFGREYGILQPNDFITSINLPQMVEMYINYGVIGIMVGMFLLGKIYRYLSTLLTKENVGDWGIVTGIVISSTLINIESNFLLVFGNIPYWIILFHVLGKLLMEKSYN